MNVGDIGYQFVREYDGVFYSGKVKSIHGDDGIRECDVSDGEKHDYTLDQLQEWRELQNDDASKVKKWQETKRLMRINDGRQYNMRKRNT